MGKRKVTKLFVVAGDIGYGNLKVSYGYTGESPTVYVKPATAAKRSAVGKIDLGNMNQQHPGVIVNVDGESWIACCSPSMIEGYVREKQHDYVSTEHYKALFHASLLELPVDEIDLYATGLPVMHFMDDEKEQELREFMIGTHQVSKSRSVTVKDVAVYPQPAGAFWKFISSIATEDDIETIEDGFVCVGDPGYFSWDWCSFVGGNLRARASGSTQAAMSRMLEVTAGIIQEEEGLPVAPIVIEEALQKGKDTVLAGARRIEYKKWMNKASEEVATEAVREMRNSFSDVGLPSIVLLPGGGAQFYEDAIQKMIVGTPVHVMGITDIVEGFWIRAASSLEAADKAA